MAPSFSSAQAAPAPSQAQRRDNRVTVYLPARYSLDARYPLLIVHDGGDFLEYAAMKTVLEKLGFAVDLLAKQRCDAAQHT